MSKTETSRNLWIGAAAIAFAGVGIIGADYIPVALESHSFHWLAIPLVISYGVAALVCVFVFAAVRGWPFPLLREPVEPSQVPVSKEHGTQLRDAATEWTGEFRGLLDPDWAVRRLSSSSLEKVDSDEGLRALRQHFPQLDSDYLTWVTMQDSLAGVPTEMRSEVSGNGLRPTSPNGMDILNKHNDVVRSMVTQLLRVKNQPSIAGTCHQCESARASKRRCRRRATKNV